MSFSKYYQDELAYLRELGREFGLAHPALAGMLAERGGDPDVERLLEGFSFLTARIRQRTEDAMPEVAQGLVQLLLPHYLRPLPSTSIVEFSPQIRALRGRLPVPRGTELATTPVEGTACRFRTTADVDLLPLQLLETTLEHPSASRPQLRVLLQTTEQGRAEVLSDAGVRFYLHGELPLTSTLFLWLFRTCRGVRVRPAGAGPEAGYMLPPEALRPVGFEPGEALFPWPTLAPDGLRLLTEYFTLPQKLLFFQVTGLGAARGAVPGDKFELVFELDRPPPLPARLGRDILKLHCVPVVNLFDVDGEPLRLELPLEEHLVRAAGIPPAHMEVFSVNAVVGRAPGQAERRAYSPFVEFAHAADGAFFHLRRSPSPVNDGWDTHLSVSTPRDVRPALKEETLSLSLTCSNRSLPTQLRLGDLSVATPSSPPLARFVNLMPVTPPARPQLGSELHWRALAHLGLNQRSLTEPGALAALLALYNFQAQGDVAAARANSLRVDAIRGVRSAAARHLVDGALVRGQRTVVELEEGGFSAPGDAFLFGAVLERLFADGLGLNAFHALNLQLSPSRLELSFPPRSGSRSLV